MNNQTFMEKIKAFIINHKIWSIIILIIVIGVLYFVFKSKASTETRYVTSDVAKGNVVVSVSGSGQIESSDTIDINAKISGEIVSVPVLVGQEVKKGQLIASVDSTDARIALETAQLSLDKLKDPTTLTLLQKENSLNSSYSDSWNNVSSFIIDMDSVVSGLGTLHSGYLQNKTQLSDTGKNKINISDKAYWDAKKSYDDVSAFYRTLSRNSSTSDLDKLTSETLDSAKTISNAVKLAQASFDYTYEYLDQSSSSTEVVTDQKNLASWTTTANTYTNSLLSNSNSITENTQALKDTQAGGSDLDIRQAELSLETKQNALNDCYVRAPFDGIIATLTAKVGQIASGSIGTLIAKQKVVKIALNEIDIAKIKLGQKATLTFDAIDGLSITGSVVGVDTVGTVSSGVVTYNVTISLDVDDARVKPGMSVSATIITNTAQDVIVVPSSAIKTKNGSSYVETFSSELPAAATGVTGSVSSVLPTQVTVEVGLADDSNTEITGGLKEGDIIVTKTIVSTTTTKTTTTPSILSAVSGGNNRGGAASGGAMRAVTGR